MNAVVVDASIVVAALVEHGPVGRWAEEVISSSVLAAPHLMPAEVANILRRAELFGDLTSDSSSLAFADLLDLRVELAGFESFAERIWNLRANLTAYDAWYVALAESLDAPLATLDLKLAGTPGPRCEFLTKD